ncbi:nADP-specific glutamate dehydrogenase [Rhodopirellula maiorica SM1]|uniref:Glutamate dehydrogenase n=1 Tax=Rhodopirellula maiorica SM1 TaxID=1265738 RepID=M5RC26_9BACT|nr:NADP-specific glutamate dehydrogenase [Rhodopirellula maiorica]EMI16621.1 nADP-specific glutamate dehydrogenase [Rhodopirellula maiorica SM1]
MLKFVREEVESFMHGLVKRNPGEEEFHQAVREVTESLMPFILQHPRYKQAQLLERLTEPDRIIIFRVTWEDDEGNFRANRAWRVQFNNSIGPYKGGLRFHPSVTQSVLKFLGFEQIFKNSLTGLPMGGAKGGSNFNPKGKSDREVMRFCHSMMIELHRHIGEHTDIPAGDIGVGSREISYLFGQYKRLSNTFVGTLTGKGLSFGGSLVRTEATGYGCVYFCENMLNRLGDSIKGKSVCISGSGNVAIYAAEMVGKLGGKVLTLSDSGGFVHDPDGIDEEKLSFVKELKEKQRGRISEYAEKYRKATFHADRRPWDVACDVALPCATQNEIDQRDAETLLKNGCIAVAEGANMPSTLEAMKAFREANILFGPAKAANAGGVAVSGLEQSQNSLRLQWTHDEVNTKLKSIMKEIHEKCVHYGMKGDHVDYVDGANLAGFVKIAESMLAYGAV